jgi:hypothetical protein
MKAPEPRRRTTNHAQAAAVFAFLADWAEAYPHRCEGDARMYRDLARAALSALEDDELCAQMSVDRDIANVICPLVRAQVQYEEVRRRKAPEQRATKT